MLAGGNIFNVNGEGGLVARSSGIAGLTSSAHVLVVSVGIGVLAIWNFCVVQNAPLFSSPYKIFGCPELLVDL